MHVTKRVAWLFLLLTILSACTSATPAPTLTPIPTPSATPIPPTTVPTSTATPTPVPTAPPPTPTPEQTNQGVYLKASVWRSELQAPIVLYHRFLPEGTKVSSRTKMRLEEFRDQLQALYDAGYGLVPIEKWLVGDIDLPAGRRPLILTMDDLFFADQIYLEPNGEPSTRSGLGVLWSFYQTHPDFGFSAGLFFNLGDKLYANKKTGNWFTLSDGWQDALAQVIVWCIEHDAMPYNHTYQHSFLDQLSAIEITDELRRNDLEIRRFLKIAKREDLIPRLGNYIGLPYGVWPATQGLKKYMLDYRDPEHQAVQAVFEAGYFYEERYFPAPFTAGFDQFRIPRITTNTQRSIDFLSEHRSLFPITETCLVGPLDPDQTDQPEAIAAAIQKVLYTGDCHEGYYRVGRYFFDVSSGEKKLIWTVENAPK